MITLNVNVDHTATVRQARGGKEPDPAATAILSELAGATGIVAHLREDRRHINDRDIYLLREVIQTKFDLEMGANDEIIKIALEVQPDLVTLVPEKRAELTTEGGLDVVSNYDKLKSVEGKMHDKDIEVSFFIEPDDAQIEASVKAGADMVEFHTGIYANTKNAKEAEAELKRLAQAAKYAGSTGLKIAAGHGLNYVNTPSICSIPEVNELSIGHSIISRAIMTGIDSAVKEMLNLINKSQKHYMISR
jgi:pyridoxine 5-phosphate synthase